MIAIKGYFYDGKTSKQIFCICRFYDNGAAHIEQIDTGKTLIDMPASEIRASPRVANSLRYLHFPGGEKFETEDNETVDLVMKRFHKSDGLHWIHRLESRWRYIGLSLLVLAFCAWLFARYGVPATASLIASRLPEFFYRQATVQTLGVLDRTLLRPSELEVPIQEDLIKRFHAVLAEYPTFKLKVLFRKGGPLGPNAFALPDGTVLFTDEMIKIAKHHDELVAVLSHEIGHVVNRHGMRSVIQDSIFAFAILAITGDVSGTSEMFLTLPVYLTELAYSRGFEDEADLFALNYLKSHNISASGFADLMRRIEKERKLKTGNVGSKSSYLSTHPLTEERLKKFDQRS